MSKSSAKGAGTRMDPLTPAQRSALMAKVRSRGNLSTEVAMTQALRRSGLSGWRRGSRLPGRPDFLFPVQGVALFVHGCFWHGCPRCYRRPKGNAAFWRAKVAGNVRRDRRVASRLRRLGLSVFTVWEHDLRDGASRAWLRRLTRRLTTGRRRSP